MGVWKYSVGNFISELPYNSVSDDGIFMLQMRKWRFRMVLCIPNKERVAMWSNELSNLGVFCISSKIYTIPIVTYVLAFLLYQCAYPLSPIVQKLFLICPGFFLSLWCVPINFQRAFLFLSYEPLSVAAMEGISNLKNKLKVVIAILYFSTFGIENVSIRIKLGYFLISVA